MAGYNEHDYDGDVHFMQKPFSPRDLAIKVREALGGNQSEPDPAT